MFALHALPVGPGRAPAPVLAGPAQGAALHGRRVASGWRRSTTWTSSARSPCTTRASTRRPAPTASTSRARATSGRPQVPNDEPLRLECRALRRVRRARAARRSPTARAALRVVRVLEAPAAVARREPPRGRRPRGAEGRRGCCVLEQGARADLCDDVTVGDGVLFGPNVLVEEGTRIGEASRDRGRHAAGQGAARWRARRAASRRAALPPLRLGVRVTVCARRDRLRGLA